MSNVWTRLKDKFIELFQARAIVLILFFCMLSMILIGRVFYLQIVKGQEYTDNYSLQIQKTKEIDGTRGNIYDRNGVLLAYNELAYAVTIEDNGEYDSRQQKNEILNDVVTRITKIIEENGDTVINKFGIILNANQTYTFTADSDTQVLRFIADVYGKAKTKDLTKEQKNSSAADIIDYLCTDPVYGYGIDQSKLSKEEVLRLINVRYAISLNSYQKYISAVVAEDVSDKTVAAIMENSDTLQGVSIEEKSVRRYTDPYCFANVIGYTGQISTEEYNDLSKADKKRYNKNDTIGKAGIEKIMDSTLQGSKGEEVIYVNNVGKVIETKHSKNPGAGNDVYLTLDANLQVAAYKLLEQEIAGIVINKMVNTLTFNRQGLEDGSDVMIPVGDVYNAFFSNDIINVSHFQEEDATAVEKEVYETFTKNKEKDLEELLTMLKDPKAKAYKDQEDKWKAYLTYIVTDFLTNNRKILLKNEIDTNDETYKAWKTAESINIYEYLTYAIAKNWIDTSAFKDYMPDKSKYSDSGEIYEGLCSFLLDSLKENNAFDKLIYKYMIRNGTLSGRNVCLLLYDQGVLNYDQDQYQRLENGTFGPYDFLRGKIETLQITPGQLGLEPSTGSLVMTNPNTGEVLACVSYPGYDNNRLANSMDSTYYNQLVTGDARPLYNNATQEKTAPGSTFKPLSAIAGLTEGVITLETKTNCSGEYKKVEPNPKCWAYPKAHGNLTVKSAIRHSCNVFFYDVGYKLGLVDNGDKKKYSSTIGLEKLKKYADELGLGTPSGIEIPEAEPQVSDENSIPSAIGQGTNNFTTTQIARYISTVANKGTVYNLSLIDKTTDPSGNVIEDYQPVVAGKIEGVADTTWTAVHEGMTAVVKKEQNSVFHTVTKKGLSLAGKTGTAQQSKTHADHGLFVGFSPVQDPQVAFAIRIANGYSSHRAAEVGRDFMAYYYKLLPEDQLITGIAAKIGKSSGGD